MSIFRDFGAASKRNAAPATTAIVVVLIAIFLANWFRVAFLSDLIFMQVSAVSKPWTFVTYGFFAVEPINIIFACLWLWGIGGALERDLGSVKNSSLFGSRSALFQQSAS